MKFKLVCRALTFALFLISSSIIYSQTTEEKETEPFNFSGGVAVTNNGVSIVPAFTLDKPAIMFDMSVGKKLTFEPQFRFSLEGVPWSFLFAFRYKLVDGERYSLKVGSSPAIRFGQEEVTDADGVTEDKIIASRGWANEIGQSLVLTKNLSLGVTYFLVRQLEKDPVNPQFIMLNSVVSFTELPKDFMLTFVPQMFYLKIGEDSGLYYSGSMSLANKNLPVSLSAMFNKTIKTDLDGHDFLWNVTLTYRFSNHYYKN